jgi:NAD(P)H-hydrate epimerase
VSHVTDLDEGRAAALLPERDARGHKGTFGRLVVVAGSLDYAGAALMTGSAALRAGCGLVTLCLPASLRPLLAGRVPELITRGLPEDEPGGQLRAEEAAAAVLGQPHEALVLGPGLVPDPGTSAVVTAILLTHGPPVVVDAGALDVLGSWPGWPASIRRACVLTPHPGELRRLGREPGSSDEERASVASAAAAAWGHVVVLKGAGTVIAAPDGRLLRAPLEVPALGTAGSGDVLAGVIGSLLAQGLSPFEAAALGVYLHARAGQELSGELGDAGLLATDLLVRLPHVRRHLRDLPAAHGPATPPADRASAHELP